MARQLGIVQQLAQRMEVPGEGRFVVAFMDAAVTPTADHDAGVQGVPVKATPETRSSVNFFGNEVMEGQGHLASAADAGCYEPPLTRP